MPIGDQIRDETIQYNINKKYQPYHQVKLISMNFLQVKKYYNLIKNKE